MKLAVLNSSVLSRVRSWDAVRLVQAKELAASVDTQAIVSAEHYLAAIEKLQALIRRAENFV